MKVLHPKIDAIRKSIGSSPIKFSRAVSSSEVPLEKRSQPSSDGRLLKQYFCIWGVKDGYGTVPIKGCFAKSIQERGPASNATYKITALYAHSQRDSVGLPSVLVEDEIGLYAEVPVLEGIDVCDALVIRHRSGTCNNGSYGFDYCWDKMEYDEATDSVIMKECELYEISFVTIGAQKETFGVRGSDGAYSDEFLEEDTDDLVKQIPRKHQLEIRTIIERHISLVKNQPIETRQKALEKDKPEQGVNYQSIINKLNFN